MFLFISILFYEIIQSQYQDCFSTLCTTFYHKKRATPSNCTILFYLQADFGTVFLFSVCLFQNDIIFNLQLGYQFFLLAFYHLIFISSLQNHLLAKQHSIHILNYIIRSVISILLVSIVVTLSLLVPNRYPDGRYQFDLLPYVCLSCFTIYV